MTGRAHLRLGHRNRGQEGSQMYRSAFISCLRMIIRFVFIHEMYKEYISKGKSFVACLKVLGLGGKANHRVATARGLDM